MISRREKRYMIYLLAIHLQERMNRKLLMDSRDVAAKNPSVDPAGEDLRLDKMCHSARIGHGYINALTIENELKFGTYNDRPEKATETNKMLTSFEMRGIKSLKEENALRIVVKRDRLAADQTFDGDWLDKETLTEVKFQDKACLVLASGQHRVAALRKMNRNHMEALSGLGKQNDKLLDMDNPSEEQLEEQREIVESMSELKGKLRMIGDWGVILYDEGERYAATSTWTGVYLYPVTPRIVRELFAGDVFEVDQCVTNDVAQTFYSKTGK